MTTISDMAGAFKTAMVTACRTAITDTNVTVCYGHPGQYQPDDIIAVGRITCTQVPGPISRTNRARDVTLTAEVHVSCFRGGPDPETEKLAGDRAYALLSLIEEQVRVTDTTLGGLVWWCFCTDHDSDGITDPQMLAKGRLVEILATFTAQARITN